MGRNQLRVQFRLLMFAAVSFLTLESTATAISKPNSKLLAAAKACEPAARSLLQQLVQIDSGTGDVAGLAAIGGVLKTELEGLGATVPPDGVVIARKGSAIIDLEITGRAAHSGLEPEKGRNAALEAAHQALQIGSLANPLKETTVNVTVLEGGKTINVIPDHALIKADVRAFTPDEFDRVELDLQTLVANTIIPDVQVKASMTRNFPPWPHVASTDALLARARKLYAELGDTLTPLAVGSSADIAFAGETGTPSIDGFGMRGGGAHSVDDYADLVSIAPRIYLLTRMLMDLGQNPPLKPMDP